MRSQRVLLGQMVVDKEPPIDLFVDLPFATVAQKSAALKERLAFLLDTRFQPAPPESLHLTVEQVAGLLHCRCRTVLRMIERGNLHPIEENGEMYFERSEIERLRHLPISPIFSRLIPRS